MNRKKLLILGGPVFQKPVVEKAKKMGLHVAVVDINADAPAASVADESFQGSIKDHEEMLRIARSYEPQAVISGACDTSVPAVAYLCKQLGLPGNSQETAFMATDKVAMLEAFKAGNVAHPSFQVVDPADIDSFALHMGYPVITKPTDSAGGRGINLVTCAEELVPALRASSEAGTSGRVLVEEFLDGPEVSVEVLAADGKPHVLQITDKLTSGAPNFFETGHIQPSSLTKEAKEQIANLAADAVKSVGIHDGAAHVEIKLTSNGPRMVELGARTGGDCITSYLIDGSVEGIDMIETMIRLALGEKIEAWEYRDSGNYVAIKFVPARPGILAACSGLEEALVCPGVIHAEITGVLGKEYDVAVDDTARFGFVIAKGSTKEEALASCDAGLAKLVFTMQ